MVDTVQDRILKKPFWVLASVCLFNNTDLLKEGIDNDFYKASWLNEQCKINIMIVLCSKSLLSKIKNSDGDKIGEQKQFVASLTNYWCSTSFFRMQTIDQFFDQSRVILYIVMGINTVSMIFFSSHFLKANRLFKPLTRRWLKVVHQFKRILHWTVVSSILMSTIPCLVYNNKLKKRKVVIKCIKIWKVLK